MTTILTKKKDTSGAPVAGDLTNATGGAELAVNTADKRLYAKNSSNAVVEVGTNPASLNLNADLTNTSGNLTVDPATQVFEIKGDGSSVEGQIQLNCHANSHGQKLKAQDHSLSATNTMLLPLGADSTLVSEVGTATLTNKTLTSPTIDGATIDTAVSVSAAGAITSGTVVSDVDGNLRDIPLSGSIKSDAYTLAVGDAGNHVVFNSANVNFTVPATTFGTGDIVSIISTNGATATVSSAITNMFVAEGASATATATIGANGVASILFLSASYAVLTGNVS